MFTSSVKCIPQQLHVEDANRQPWSRRRARIRPPVHQADYPVFYYKLRAKSIQNMNPDTAGPGLVKTHAPAPRV